MSKSESGRREYRTSDLIEAAVLSLVGHARTRIEVEAGTAFFIFIQNPQRPPIDEIVEAYQHDAYLVPPRKYDRERRHLAKDMFANLEAAEDKQGSDKDDGGRDEPEEVGGPRPAVPGPRTR